MGSTGAEEAKSCEQPMKQLGICLSCGEDQVKAMAAVSKYIKNCLAGDGTDLSPAALKGNQSVKTVGIQIWAKEQENVRRVC